MNKKLLKIGIPALSFLVILSTGLTMLGSWVWNRTSRGIRPTKADITSLWDSNQVYNRVIIFGVDGAGGCFGELDTPHFDRIFQNGSVTYNMMCQFPTDSAPNWCSMMHGVRYIKHHVQNGDASSKKFEATEYPSFFRVYSQYRPDPNMVSICNWSPINYGIIEDNIPGMRKINAGPIAEERSEELGGLTGARKVDRMVANLVLEEIENGDAQIIYMHFDSVDAAGHSFGRGKPEYLNAISFIDGLLGEIYDATTEKGWADNTLFLCVSDHGHLPDGGHGSNDKEVRKATLAVAGNKGNIIKGTPGYSVTQDVASIVCYALGVQQDSSWESTVPENMFAGLLK